MATILVVDDSKIDLKRASSLLAKRFADDTILTARDGLEALEIIKQHRPGVVVTDLKMPNMNGLELVEEVRESFPSIPVVLMTAAGSEQIAAEALAKGAASYVPKRELTVDLAAIVSRLLGAVSEKQQQHRLRDSVMEARFVLDNDKNLISVFLQELRESLDSRRLFTENECLRLISAVHEAFANAYYHGNLEVSSRLREQDAHSFQELADERSGQIPFNRRRIFVRTLFDHDFTISIRDEGPGFSVRDLPDPRAPGFVDRPCGRGLLLMQAFMDDVEFNEAGNQVTMVKKRLPAIRDSA